MRFFCSLQENCVDNFYICTVNSIEIDYAC